MRKQSPIKVDGRTVAWSDDGPELEADGTCSKCGRAEDDCSCLTDDEELRYAGESV